MGAPTVVVVNPNSRNGATGRRWRQIERRVRERLGEIQVESTRGPRDAERIAREAAAGGAQRIVVAGGDGTASEVVAGLLDASLGMSAVLAFLPLGTGGDWRRTLGTPRSLSRALDGIVSGGIRRIDAGRITFRAPDGEERRTYFVNVASAGLSGFVDKLVNEAPKTLGGTASFLIGTLRGLARFREVGCRVTVDGEIVHDGPIVLVTAANGRYFGGGMQVAPRARPDDGRLDAVVVPGVSRFKLLAALPDLYRGRHLERPEITFRTGQRIEVDGHEELYLDVDGECVPARRACFEVVPGALRVIAPADPR